MSWSLAQRRMLEAMGYTVVAPRAAGPLANSTTLLGEKGVPPRLRAGLERWVGAMWASWPAPEGQPGDAAFKRVLWRRVRDWRRGG